MAIAVVLGKHIRVALYSGELSKQSKLHVKECAGTSKTPRKNTGAPSNLPQCDGSGHAANKDDDSWGGFDVRVQFALKCSPTHACELCQRVCVSTQ